MKKSLQLLVIILLTAAVVPEAFAYNFVSGGIYYDITGSSPNTVAVTYATGSYNSYSGSVDIPNTVTYNGTTYTVTAIGNNAFRKCSNLTGVSIPNTVTSIGEYAFYQCGNLHSVNLSNELTTIGAYAFGRSGLFSVTIPASVTTIGTNAFEMCNSLTSAVFNATNCTTATNMFYYCNYLTSLTMGSNVQTIPGNAFAYCNAITSVFIPHDVSTIGTNPFHHCTSLDTIEVSAGNPVYNHYSCNVIIHEGSHTLVSGCKSSTIPNSVRKIGDFAFAGCTGLTGPLTISNQITVIGASAYSGCSGLTSLVVGTKVDSIGKSAFSNCIAITSVSFNADSCRYMGASNATVFSGCDGFSTLLIGSNVKAIPAQAFRGCNHLTGLLTIPNSVQNIGDGAFYGCNGLTSLSIGNHVQSIGGSAFYNCSNMGSTLTIPQMVVSIGSSAFSGCTGFTSIAFNADSCTTGSLSGCSNVTSLSIGNNVKVIPASAFSGLSLISGALTIPNSVQNIRANAFYGCNGLTGALIIPDSVKTIGDYAFNNCSGLDSLFIGKSIENIGSSAFNSCSGLSFVDFNADSCISMGSDYGSVFAGCTNPATLIIRNNVKAIPNFAFKNFRGIDTLVIGNSVSYIGYDAFSNCRGLTLISFNADSCTNVGNNYSAVISVFDGCDHPATLTIGNNVKCIPPDLFRSCSGLTGTLVIPDSLRLIGSSAFKGCSGLDTLIIGRSISKIGIDAFRSCSRLNTVFFNADSCVLMGGPSDVVFGSCDSIASFIIGSNVKYIPPYTLMGHVGPLGKIIIPDSVVSIGKHAFSGCVGLDSLVFGTAVTFIGESAFNGCSGLIGELHIPNVDTIKKYAFENCSGLNALIFGEDTRCIDYSAFYNCIGLTGLLNIPDNITSIGAYAFYNCSGLDSLIIGKSVAIIGGYAFGNCNRLSSVVFNSDSCIEMGGNDLVFEDCTNITSLKIGNNVKVIPYKAFRNLSALSGALVIPDSVKNIGDYAFSGCSMIDTLVIGRAVNSIPSHAFGNFNSLTTLVFNADSCGYLTYNHNNEMSVFTNCDNLTTLTIGEHVKYIPYLAFSKCIHLTGTIVIPDSVRTISSSSFKGCSGIDTLIIGKHVQFIGGNAFQNCTGLSSVAFNPDNCITMGSWYSNNFNHTVFNGCANIASLTIGENVKNIPSYAFLGCNHITGSLTVPDSVINIGDGAFQGCSGFSSMSIGRSVDSIGHSAFYGCTGLTSIESYNVTPPVLNLSSTHPFNSVSRNTPVYVPCGSAQDYRNEWKYSTNNTSSYFYNIYENLLPYSFSVSSEDTLKGTAQISTMPSCTESAIIEATPKFFYNFDHWSDGNTDNHRTITLTQDTALVAYFREYTIMVSSNDTTAGMVHLTGLPTPENPQATIEAVLMDSCFVFAGWSDGSFDNPHTIFVSQDTLLSATFNSVVNLQITAPTTVCQGDSATLAVTGAESYLWFNGDTSSTIKILPDNSMVVTVTGTDNNGCSTSKGHHINVQSNPTLTFSGYTVICEGDSTIITAISSISINNILFENFADGVPSDWTIANNYLHTESLSGNHDKALVFPAYNLGHGFSDELIIPVQNLSIIQEPTLQFDVANSESVFYSGQESLSVFYSMDEGVTWNELYNKYGYSLATVSENTNQNFIPSDTQWRTETIDLTGVSGNVIIKFVFESDFYNYDHNNVWLDNIVLKPKINTQNVLLYEDFENPLSEEWGNIDTYGNGDAWLSSTHYSNDGIPAANRGEKCIVSVNQQNQCEHQLLTPTITIPTSGATLSYYINGYISSYAECIVYVVSNTQTEPLYFNFLMNSGWGKASVDLSAWAGEDIQIMFVHKWDYIVMLDDIMVLANDNYIWSDGSMSSQHSFSSSGTWQVTASDINGCHTTDSVTIAVWQPDTTEISINSPESFYVLNDEVFCQSGDYTQILQNSHGCDSVVNLHLTLAPQDTVVINDTICRGYRDVLVNAPAQYLEDYGITDPNLSDTVKVSSLHYYDENYNYISIEIDQNYWDTHDYYLLSQVKAFTNTYGCDSIVVYNKYMTFSDWIMIWDTVCGSYNWNGTTFTNSGEYYEVETYTNARGCTSSVNLTLTIFSSTYEELSANACESYTLNDITYTESGVYTQYTDTLLPIQREAYYNEWEDYWYYFDNYGNFHYSESETYIDTILGCKVTTLNLTINHATASDTIATACDNFEWHGTSYTESGEYPLTLTNAAGCDSTVTLHLTVNYSTVNDFSDTACDSYTWNDSTYTFSGNYTQTFTAANNCDSVVTLHLTINNSDHIELTAVACGEYVWLDSTYTTSGNYSKTYTNIAGCDSIVTLHLTINPIPEVSITGNTTICPDGGTMLTATGADSYLWSNWSTSTSIPVNMFGVYSVTGTSAAGCTNTASVTVLVAQPPVITIIGDLELCAGNTGAITAHGGNTYMWSNGSTDSSITVCSTGSWQVIGYDENGCNSMASATVTVWQHASSQFSVTVNDSCYIWNTISYCESGTYTQTLQTVHGCDSVVTLHLTLTTTVYVDVYETACNNYTWNNVTYDQSGNYTQIFSMANGADSVVTLHLTVNPIYAINDARTICASELPFIWNGVQFTEAATQSVTLQTINDCDSVVTMTLTVNPTYAVNDARTICASELPFIWNGVQFTEAGTQSVTLQTINDCDSVVTMTLTVNQPSTGVDVQTACGSFTWIDGIVYTESTNAPIYTLTNAVGCDSTVTLHLTVNTPTEGDTSATVCGSFSWYEYSDLTQSGTYIHTLTNAAGCDSTVTLHLTVNVPTEGDTTAVVCGSFDWHGYTNLTQSGDYADVLTNAVGCDSIVTLHLTVNTPNEGDTTAIVCGSFDWHGYTNLTQSGDYTDVLTNTAGCDSTVTLHLTVNMATEGDTTAVVCGSFDWHGYTNLTQSGDYTDVLTNAAGCDSIVTLHLTVNTSTEGDTTASVCNSFDWYGMHLAQSGDYNHTLTNAAGCDSIVTLHLTVNTPTEGDTIATVCGSFSWYGYSDLTQSGTYTHTLTNAVGCDSVVTLHLTVNQPVTSTSTATICDSELPYVWNGLTFNEAGTQNLTLQTVNGCDSVVEMTLSVNPSVTIEAYLTISDNDLPFTYGDTTFMPGTVQSGDYVFNFTTADGCDSIIILHLTVETGISSYDLNANMKVYPNPTSDIVNVQLTMNNEQLNNVEIQVFDIYGKLLSIVETRCTTSLQQTEPIQTISPGESNMVNTHGSSAQTTQINLSQYAKGVYFVKAVSDGKIIAVRKVVKR